ncbi:MAG: YggU family protein [Gammaproteobacteria bacterium]|nr:YggU family protein [Gammaproteobacteria bacterium]
MSAWRWQGPDLILELRVQPRASRDEISGLHGERLKVRITAPPVDGAANSHLLAFLAKVFGVAKSQVTLLAGESGREKRVRIEQPRQLPPGIPAQ